MRHLSGIIFLFTLLLAQFQPLHAIDSSSEDFEEVLVFVRVQGVGGFDINAIYGYETDKLYLPVTDLFNFLKIRVEPEQHFLKVSGFFIDENRTYEIDHPSRTITIDGRTLQFGTDDMVRTETGLYLYTGIFGRAFGLHSRFHFRSMSVDIRTDLELPAIREMRLAQLRRNLEQLRGEVVADTTLERSYHLFRMGMFDWAFSSTQVTQQTTDNRISLGLGTELLAGETNLFLNYSSRDGFNMRNQQYQWRFVNNDLRALRQVRVGKVGPGSISSIFEPLHGITITNAATTFRRSFGEYTLSDHTEPGWTVELYVNNVLVAYQVADASGYYSFDVPLVYGASQVMLKFYGPYGEERVREQFLNIPFHFLPKGEVEYTVTAGLLQDTLHSRYARAAAGVGVTRFLTLGGGIEYLTSIPGRTDIPFTNISLAPLNNLLLHGEYAHGVNTKALLSYRLPNNIMLELNYVNYAEEQKAIRFNYLEERRAMLNLPFSTKWLRGSARLAYRQNVYESLNFNTVDATFSTSFGPVSSNISTYATWVTERDPYIYSNLTLGIRLWRSVMVRPSIQYDFTQQELVSYKVDIEHRFRRTANLSLGYQENVLADYRSVELAFRWDMPFAQFNTSARLSNFDLTTTQGARGSIALGSGNRYVHIDSRGAIGRSGITIIPFIDINHNGIRDEGEPLATGLNVRLNGGRTLRQVNDTLIRIIELEPYISYILKLDDANLDNIAWQLSDKVIEVKTDPNQFKQVYIAVKPVGEINGMITLREENRVRGLGRVLLNVYDTTGTLVRQVMSESDGFVTYLGMPPGSYYATIDPVQLERIGMQATPDRIPFDIEPMIIGDIVDGLDFELERITQPVEPTGDVDVDQTEEEATTETPSPDETGAEDQTPDDREMDEETPIDEEERVQKSHDDGETGVDTDTHTKETMVEHEEPVTEQVSISHEDEERVLQQEDSREQNDRDLFSPAAGRWFLQSGAFSNVRNTVNQYQQLHTNIEGCQIGVVYVNGLFRIRLGHFETRQEALQCQSPIQQQGRTSYLGSSEHGPYYFEVNTLNDLSEALVYAKKIGDIIHEMVVVQQRGGLFVVQTGFTKQEHEMFSLLDKLRARGYPVDNENVQKW